MNRHREHAGTTRSRRRAWIGLVALALQLPASVFAEQATVAMPRMERYPSTYSVIDDKQDGKAGTRQPTLFVMLNPEQAHVQQQIVQRIRLQSPDPFDALDVDAGTVEGADMMTLQTPSTRAFEAWGARGWVYETTRAFFAQHSGKITIPAVTIQGRIQKSNGTRVAFKLHEPAHELAIKPPEPGIGGESWLVATEVNMSERWSIEPSRLHAGDITQRTIEIVATGVSAEHIPTPSMPVSQGIMVLNGPIERKTQVTDDGLIGRLTRVFDVRVATEEITDISPIQIPWWNTQLGRLQRATVKAWRIEPLPADVDALADRLITQAAQTQERARRTLQSFALALVLALLLIGSLVWRIRGRGGYVDRAMTRISDLLLGERIELPSIEQEARFGRAHDIQPISTQRRRP